MKRNKTIIKEINKMFPAISGAQEICYEDNNLVKVMTEFLVDIPGDLLSPTTPAEYYGFPGSDSNSPWIHLKLEEYAEKLNAYWEWESPACLVLAKTN